MSRKSNETEYLQMLQQGNTGLVTGKTFDATVQQIDRVLGPFLREAGVLESQGVYSTTNYHYLSDVGSDSNSGRSATKPIKTISQLATNLNKVIGVDTYVFFNSSSWTITDLSVLNNIIFVNGAKLYFVGDTTLEESALVLDSSDTSSITLDAATLTGSAHIGHFFAYAADTTTKWPISANTTDTMTLPTLTSPWSTTGTGAIYSLGTTFTAASTLDLNVISPLIRSNNIIFKNIKFNVSTTITCNPGVLALHECHFDGTSKDFVFTGVKYARNFLGSSATATVKYIADSDNAVESSHVGSATTTVLTETDAYSAASVTLYVRSTGDDENSGYSVASALATIDAALDKAKFVQSYSYAEGDYTIEAVPTIIIDIQEAGEDFDLGSSDIVLNGLNSIKIVGATRTATGLTVDSPTSVTADLLSSGTQFSIEADLSLLTAWGDGELSGKFIQYTGSTDLIPILNNVDNAGAITIYLPYKATAYATDTAISLVECATTVSGTSAISMISTSEADAGFSTVFENLIIGGNLNLLGIHLKECTGSLNGNTTSLTCVSLKDSYFEKDTAQPNVGGTLCEGSVLNDCAVCFDVATLSTLSQGKTTNFAHPLQVQSRSKLYFKTFFDAHQITNQGANHRGIIDEVVVIDCERDSWNGTGTGVNWLIENGTLLVDGLTHGSFAGGILGEGAYMKYEGAVLDGTATEIEGTGDDYVIEGQHGSQIIFSTGNDVICTIAGPANKTWRIGYDSSVDTNDWTADEQTSDGDFAMDTGKLST